MYITFHNLVCKNNLKTSTRFINEIWPRFFMNMKLLIQNE